jgi:predicted transcriptional regulator
MSMQTVTVEVTEESVATIDEIAANMRLDRASVLREAISSYLADYAQLVEDIEQAGKDIQAGDFTTQNEMEARFEARTNRAKAA